jgi:hypothetical protein
VGAARTADHPIDDQFGRRFLQEDDSSYVVPPPESPIERMLHDREGYQMPPTPRQRRIESLPGGNYLQEE